MNIPTKHCLSVNIGPGNKIKIKMLFNIVADNDNDRHEMMAIGQMTTSRACHVIHVKNLVISHFWLSFTNEEG